MHTTRTLSVAAAAAALLLLAGCGAQSGAMSTADQPMPNVEQSSPDVQAQEGGGMSSGDAPSDQSSVSPVVQQLIITGSAQLEVDHPIDVADAVTDLAASSGGSIESRTDASANDDRNEWSQLTIRVPQASLDALVDDLRELGEVTDLQMSQSDVTGYARDLTVRIDAARASVERLTQLLATAADTETLLQIEEQLTQRTSELEQLESEQTQLSDQVALSTLDLSISTSSTVSPSEPTTFWDGLVAGWGGLVAAVGATLVGLGALAPWLLPIAVIAGIVWLIVRATRRRRQAARDARAADAASRRAAAGDTADAADDARIENPMAGHDSSKG